MDINETMVVSFIYGISGTLKTTTLNASASTTYLRPFVMKSGIKRWKDLELGTFSGKTEINDLNYALLHLCRLSDSFNYCYSEGINNLFVERGITDMLYYKSKKTELEDEFIWKAVEEENKILTLPENSGIDLEVERKLLIMKDENFIQNKILSSQFRSKYAQFKDLDDYFNKQQEYVDFTKKYNNINVVCYINSAEEYINELGLKFFN